MNAPLMKGYYLKESLREIWMQVTKEQAQQVLMNWVEQAQDSKVPLLQKFAMTLMAHRSGILSWYDRPSYLYRETGRDKQQNQNNEETSIWI